jgi:hypothetical protein
MSGTQERVTQGEAHKPLSSPLAEKACKAGRMTKSPPSKPARQGERLSPCRASLRGGANDEVPDEQASEVRRTSEPARKEPRPTLLAHDGHDRTHHHKTMFGPCCSAKGGHNNDPCTRKDRTTRLAHAHARWRVTQGHRRKMKSY